MKTGFLTHIHPPLIQIEGARIAYTGCLGGISFLLFIVLSATGLLLMFYYLPTEEGVYPSVQDIAFLIPFGALLRNLHYWAGQGMVAAVMLHLIRVFYTGAYQPPRQLNWVVGMILLLLTFLLDFTGYLLRWDQDSFWAVTVGMNLISSIPLLGPSVHLFLAGGESLGPEALLRFYVFHCLALPVGLFSLALYHFWRIRRDGGISGPL